MEQESKWIRDIQRSGSRQAAERLVEWYYDEIYIFVYRQTRHKEDAMDLTRASSLRSSGRCPPTTRRRRPSAPGSIASLTTRSLTPAASPGP